MNDDLVAAVKLLERVGEELGLNLVAESALRQIQSRTPEDDFKQWIESEYRRRMKRRSYFSDDLLGEPCWDMLLDLAAASLGGRDIAVSSACLASGVPQTTALRWIKVMDDEGLILREPDPLDRRKIMVKISQKALDTLYEYFKRWA